MKKYACIFPGQGSQEVGMADSFLSDQNYSDILKTADSSLGIGLTDLMSKGPQEELTLTFNAQPAILTVSMLCWQALKSALDGEIQPAYVAGHSLGEFSALCASGAMEFSDAVKLVQYRGQLMQEAVPKGEGAMAAMIGGTDDDIRKLVEVSSENEILDVANLNAPGQTVISGHRTAVERAVSKAGEFGIKRAVLLDVSAPFHSRLMSPVREKFTLRLDETDFSIPDFPIVHNVNADANMDNGKFVDLLSRQIDSPVRWTESVEFMLNAGVEMFIEVGHGKVLQGLVKKIAGKDWNGIITGVEKPSDIENILQILKEHVS